MTLSSAPAIFHGFIHHPRRRVDRYCRRCRRSRRERFIPVGSVWWGRPTTGTRAAPTALTVPAALAFSHGCINRTCRRSTSLLPPLSSFPTGTVHPCGKHSVGMNSNGEGKGFANGDHWQPSARTRHGGFPSIGESLAPGEISHRRRRAFLENAVGLPAAEGH